MVLKFWNRYSFKPLLLLWQQQEGKIFFLYRLLLSVFILTLHLGSDAFAQVVPYKYYDITKIQSNEVIKGISKDKRGFVWLATDQGVLRFDGTETNLFIKELPSPFTKKFLQRKNGTLLVLTDFGVKEIIHNQDTTYFQPMEVGGEIFEEPLNYPKSIFEDREGNLWIGEVNAVVKISTTGFKRYELGPQYQSINYHRSFSFTEDAFGHIWVAPYTGRLLSYKKEVDQLMDVEIEYPLSEVSSITSWKGDHLIVGGKEGILKLKIDSDKRILETDFLPELQGVSTTISVNQEVFVGTWENGLYQANFTFFPNRFFRIKELPFNDMLDFDYDEVHNEIWITGSENIGLLKPSLISTVGEAGQYRIESLAYDSVGTFYFSTGPQIFQLDGNGHAEQIFSSKTTYFDRVLGDGEKLWIGDAFGNISYFDLLDKNLTKVWDRGSKAILFIFKDRSGNKWFTGLPLGLVKVNPSGKLKVYEQVPNSVVIKESLEGQLFCGGVGKDSLLYRYDATKDQFDLLTPELDFPATADLKAEDLEFDSLGHLWIASNEGLLKVYEEKKKLRAERILLKGIIANEHVKAIAITGEKLWLAYSRGLAVYNKGEIVFYTRENGLPSRLLKERCFLEKGHKLYVGTAKGLALIDLAHQTYHSTPAPLVKGILVNGKKYRLSDKENITLPYGSRVQVNYVSPSYPGNNIVYQTKMAGLENDWSEPTTNSSMSVLGFPEGNYTLQVRARDTGYLWSTPVLVKFSISTPWFRTWWAMLSLGLAGVLLILTSVKVYHFHLIGQKRKLQRLVEARTKEINLQKNEIIEQKNKIIQQKEELIEKNNAVFKSEKALSEADLNYLHLKEKQLQDQIEYRNKQITTHTLNIIQKNEMLKELRDQLEGIVKSTAGAPHSELKKLLKIIDESFRLDKDWEEFKLYFEQIYTGFYAKLKVNYPELTNQELRHCALIRLNLSNTECASILGISPNSIKVTRTRLRKKLHLENHQSLTDFIMGI